MVNFEGIGQTVKGALEELRDQVELEVGEAKRRYSAVLDEVEREGAKARLVMREEYEAERQILLEKQDTLRQETNRLEAGVKQLEGQLAALKQRVLAL